MGKIIHSIYKEYPEQPYISPDRDLKAWVNTPENFPYGIVEKKQMQRLPEGILPGHVVMLWRIHFNNFTNQTLIPQYFEYRYGVDSDECIATLTKLGYIKICGARQSLDVLNMVVLKRILQASGLPTSGKKEELLKRILENIPEEQLASQVSLRKYEITPIGQAILDKYDDIIQKHGPKM